jgi:pimeloyl-ACP methyl ester carboxylesterase
MSTKFLAHAGGQIAYDDTGVGPLVVLVPGLGDVRGVYRFLAPRLVEAGYRVVTMDIRGHGETSASWSEYSLPAVGGDILALVRGLDAGPAVIGGTSFAAGAAAWAAVEAPDLVCGVLMFGPAVHGEVSAANRLFYSALFARPWGPALWIKYFQTLFPSRKPADFDRYKAALQANLREPGRVEALRSLILATKRPSEERLGQVRVPVLALMGTRDPDFKDPRAEAEWVAAQVNGAYEMIEGAGHYPQAEFVEETAAHVLRFLSQVLSHDA